MNILDEIIESFLKKTQSKINREIKKNLPTITNEIAQEASHMYDALIDSYYGTYTPDFYIRHMDRGRGFSMGLYSANRICATTTGIRIFITGETMMDDYEHDSADDVLENVMSGIRGIPEYWHIYWYVKYEGTYHSYSGGNMHDAFNVFVNEVIPEILKKRVNLIFSNIFK